MMTIKVLHLPTSTGGNSWGLSQAERKLGIDSSVLYSSSNWLNYEGDIVLRKSKFKSVYFLKLLIETINRCRKYDVYHFNFGSSLLDFPMHNIHLADLPLYHGKKLLVTYNGSDARQFYRRYMQDSHGNGYYVEEVDNSYIPAILKKQRIKKFEKFGVEFFAVNPDIMRFLPDGTHFLPYTIANWDKITINEKKEKKGKITIVHAPTDRYIKGSDSLFHAIERINIEKSGKIDFILIEKMSHEDALKAYKNADIIVDQLKIGWYGAFAVEAIKSGIPVLAYICTDDLKYIPPEIAKDVMEAFPSVNEFNVGDVLSNLIENPSRLKIIKDAQTEYVWKWHDPIKVAKYVAKYYES